MSYSDKTFFLRSISQEDLDRLTGGDDNNLTAKIAVADSEIDSYLKAVIKSEHLPLTVVPDKVKQLSFDIAMYYLHARSDFADVPKRIKELYDNAVEYLKNVAQSKVQIPGIDASKYANNVIFYSTDGNLISRKT